MGLFDDVFNKASVYNTLFLNIKSVLVYPTLEELKTNNAKLYERWMYLNNNKYAALHGTLDIDYDEKIYSENATYYPEYVKIVAISYATLYSENGELKREFKRVANLNEKLVIDSFMDDLNILSESLEEKKYPILCGHNVISFDIPLLIKRHILYNSSENFSPLPNILKKSLTVKPWESGIIDTINVWKFNGYENTPLMLICDYLGLKRTVDLLSLPELSNYFWNNIGVDEKKTLDFMSLQSATQTNLVIQLMNLLRKF